jgi:hypothetical protein
MLSVIIQCVTLVIVVAPMFLYFRLKKVEILPRLSIQRKKSESRDGKLKKFSYDNLSILEIIVESFVNCPTAAQR